MIVGIQDVYYNVQNMERAVRFYKEAFGMNVVFSDKYWSTLELEGLHIGLHWTEGEPVPPLPKDEHGAHAGATITFRSNDIRNDWSHIQNLGGRFLGQADAPWGLMVVFQDLDGNVLKLMQPKSR